MGKFEDALKAAGISVYGDFLTNEEEVKQATEFFGRSCTDSLGV